MVDWLHGAVGFVSAALVALIALGFGALFLFFSGSAVLVFGRFLPFARPARVAAVAIVTSASLAAGVVLFLDLAPLFRIALPVSCLLWGALAWAMLRAPRMGAWVRRVVGLYLLATAGLFGAALQWSALAVWAQRSALGALGLFNVAVLGFVPLVLAGGVEHLRQKRVEWFLSLRYLVARRRQTFISVISIICVLGVALGVAVITSVLSVMNGFESIWHERIFSNRAHFVIQSGLGPFEEWERVRETALGVDAVVGASPYVLTDAVLRSESGEIQAVLLKGIDPKTVATTTGLVHDLIAGSLDALAPVPGASGVNALPGVILGSALADRFLLRVGDPALVISPLGGPPTPLGPSPRLVRYRVAGIFRANFFQFDESFAYVDLGTAQSFMKAGGLVTGVEVKTTDPYRSQAVGDEVTRRLGGLYYVRDWKEFYPGFFQALKSEQAMMFVLLSFIMVVAGFIIVATLLMMIMEKSRDIAILKAMGCEDEGILRIFAIEGGLIGLGGTALGLGMGLVITWNLDRIQSVVERILGFDVLPVNVYQLGSLPFRVDLQQLLLIAAIAMTLSLGATLLPSWQASRVDPAEALRYE